MKKLVLLAFLASSVCTAFAQAPKARARPMPPHGMMPFGTDPIVRMLTRPDMAEKIGLSAEQKAKLDAALKGDKENMKAMQGAVSAASRKQAELLKATPVDEAAVMAAIDEVFAARKEIAKAQTKKLIAVRAILTPEQIAKAGEILRESRRGPGAGTRKGPPKPAAEKAPAEPAPAAPAPAAK